MLHVLAIVLAVEFEPLRCHLRVPFAWSRSALSLFLSPLSLVRLGWLVHGSRPFDLLQALGFFVARLT